MKKETKKLVILGASAVSEISEIIRDINKIEEKYEVIGILDDNSELHNTEAAGIKVKGNLELVHSYPEYVSFVFGIGSYKTRIARFHILRKLGIPDSRFETLLHPSAKIYSSASIGYGCIIHEGTVIFNHTISEPFVVVVANTVIGVRNIVGRGALITSLVSSTQNVKIGNFSFIGTSTAIAENVEIGPGAMIGMGSVILQNVKPGMFVLGNPLKFLDKIDIPTEILKDWEITKNTGRSAV